LLDVLPDGPVKSTAGVLMVVHLIVTYTIYQQVLIRAVCRRFLPGALEHERLARVKWFLVSTSFMAVGWVVANAIPLFSNIVNITGGALCPQYAFTFPPLFYLAMLSRGSLGKRTGRQTAMAVAAVLTLILSAYSTVVGTLSSVIVMVNDLNDAGAPFGCKLPK